MNEAFDSYDMLRGAVLGAFSVTMFVIIAALIYYRRMTPYLKSVPHSEPTKAVALTLGLLSHLHLLAATWFTATYIVRFVEGLAIAELDPPPSVLINYIIAFVVLSAPAGALFYTLYRFERTRSQGGG